MTFDICHCILVKTSVKLSVNIPSVNWEESFERSCVKTLLAE